MGTVDYFERKLDDKRRLTIPTELRDKFASGAVVTRGFGKYLHLYPEYVWDEQVEPKLAGDILDERGLPSGPALHLDRETAFVVPAALASARAAIGQPG